MLKFRNGTNSIVFGMTGSGKTSFVLEILKKRLVTNFPDTIYYLYKVKQPFMSTWNNDAKNPSINFIEGLELKDVLEKGNCICVIDDLVMEKLSRATELFIYGSHHLNITTFFLTQNLFPKDENFKMMSLNATYFVLFTNLRSIRQIKTLAQQSFTKDDQKRVEKAYKRASARPFGFILLNFLTDLPRELAVCSNYFENPSYWL